VGEGSSAPERLRVVIAEDNYLVREGTRRLLEDSGAVDVVAAVGTAHELLDAVSRLRPDAVVTDIRMPPGHHMEGIEAAHAIRRSHPGVGVMVLSQHADQAYAFELFKDGTSGLAYLLKDRVGELDELLHALREVVAGRSVIDPQVVEVLVASRARIAESPVSRLTPRELEVLQEMAQGKANVAIAQALYLSESAIEKHVNSIFAKLGLSQEPQLHRRVAAVLEYLREAGTGASSDARIRPEPTGL
jgi:DNA-binding NarL/FixJ family response regulator